MQPSLGKTRRTHYVAHEVEVVYVGKKQVRITVKLAQQRKEQPHDLPVRHVAARFELVHPLVGHGFAYFLCDKLNHFRRLLAHDRDDWNHPIAPQDLRLQRQQEDVVLPTNRRVRGNRRGNQRVMRACIACEKVALEQLCTRSTQVIHENAILCGILFIN